jgi:hypothetical protein
MTLSFLVQDKNKSTIKSLMIKKKETSLPLRFINFKGKRFIHVISCHLNPENNILGYSLHSNINHDDFDFDDRFTCFINEFFLPRRFSYSDFQLYEIKIKVKDPEGNEINLEEINPETEKPRYKLRLELLLEMIDE